MAVDHVIAPDDPAAEQVRFGRNRFLAALGGGLFGFATNRILRSEPALAQHLATPYPCYGFPGCHYCDGSMCYKYCHWHDGHSHCPSGGQYWETCTPNGNRYRCRDWHEQFPGYDHHHCICSVGLGRC